MKYLKLVIILCILSAFIACIKDKPQVKPEPEKVYPDYSALKVGNYWVYQWLDVDKNGRDSALQQFDSSYIEKDTLIRNNKYFKLKTEGDVALNPTAFLRDSLHYHVNERGEIQYTSEDFNRIFRTYYSIGSLEDTICRVDLQTDEAETQFQTPAGNFSTRNTRYTFYFYPKYTYGKNPRFTYNRFAENVGMITEAVIWGVMNQGYREKRLVRYKAS